MQPETDNTDLTTNTEQQNTSNATFETKEIKKELMKRLIKIRSNMQELKAKVRDNAPPHHKAMIENLNIRQHSIEMLIENFSSSSIHRIIRYHMTQINNYIMLAEEMIYQRASNPPLLPNFQKKEQAEASQEADLEKTIKTEQLHLMNKSMCFF